MLRFSAKSGLKSRVMKQLGLRKNIFTEKISPSSTSLLKWLNKIAWKYLCVDLRNLSFKKDWCLLIIKIDIEAIFPAFCSMVLLLSCTWVSGRNDLSWCLSHNEHLCNKSSIRLWYCQQFWIDHPPVNIKETLLQVLISSVPIVFLLLWWLEETLAGLILDSLQTSGLKSEMS